MPTRTATQAVLVKEAAATLAFLEYAVGVEQRFAVGVADRSAEQQTRAANAFRTFQVNAALAQRTPGCVEFWIQLSEIYRDRFRQHLAKAKHLMRVIVDGLSAQCKLKQ